MKKTIIAMAVACAAAFSFAPAASADSLKIIVKPKAPVVKKVVIRKPCYYKTVKKYKANKTVITKVKVCP